MDQEPELGSCRDDKGIHSLSRLEDGGGCGSWSETTMPGTPASRPLRLPAKPQHPPEPGLTELAARPPGPPAPGGIGH